MAAKSQRFAIKSKHGDLTSLENDTMSNSDRLPRRNKYQSHNHNDRRPNTKRNSWSSTTGGTVSFTDLQHIGNNRSSSPANDIFKNFKTIADSPTASATTFSSSGGSSGNNSPYGSGHSPYGGSPHGGMGMMSNGGRSGNASPAGAIAPRTPDAPAIPLTPITPMTPATPASTTEASSSSRPKDGSSHSPGYSTASRASSMYSEHNIDHTALLLGFHDEFSNNNNGCLLGGDDDDDGDRESYAESYESDDEREWNACFSPNVSLDELDKKAAALALGVEKGGVKRAMEDDGDGDEESSVEDGSVYVNVGRYDDESSDDEGLQLDIGCATLEDMPVTYAHDNGPMSFPSVGISNHGDSPQNKDFSPTTEVIKHANKLRPTRNSQNDDHHERSASTSSPNRAINHSTNPSATWHNGHGHYFNDDDDVNEAQYIRKNINSMERKRHAAKMKALAMKERASSALVAKTIKAKEKVRELKERRQGAPSSQQAHRQRVQQKVLRGDELGYHYERQQLQTERQQRERPDYGMEITTNTGEPQVFSPVSEASYSNIHCYDTHHADTTTASSSPSLPPLPSPLPPSPTKKHHHFKSKLLTQLANAKSKHLTHHHAGGKSVTTAASAVSSMKDKASSALSQKANRAKVMVASSLSSSPMVRVQQRKHAMRNSLGTAGGRRVVTALQRQTSSSVSLLSMEESYSDYAPSSGAFANSVEGAGTTIAATSNDALESGLFPNDASAIFPDAYSNDDNDGMFDTPKATSSSKKGLLDGNLRAMEDMHMAVTLRRNNVTGGEEKEIFRNMHHHLHLRGIPNIGSPSSTSTMSQHYAPLPPTIAACASNLSSHAANASQISCIDENGFLLSPAASMDGLVDGAGGTPGGGLSTALSNVGSESSFDPNSFLFLSPLSNTDMDDPDYGMPELLSRSNSRNATHIHAANCSTVTAPGGGGSAIVIMGGPSDERTKAAAMAPLSSTARYGKHASRLIPRLPPSPRLLPPSGKKMIKKMKGAATSRNSSSGGSGNDDGGNHGVSNHATAPSNHVTGMKAMVRHLKPPLGHRRTTTSSF